MLVASDAVLLTSEFQFLIATGQLTKVISVGKQFVNMCSGSDDCHLTRKLEMAKYRERNPNICFDRGYDTKLTGSRGITYFSRYLFLPDFEYNSLTHSKSLFGALKKKIFCVKNKLKLLLSCKIPHVRRSL